LTVLLPLKINGLSRFMGRIQGKCQKIKCDFFAAKIDVFLIEANNLSFVKIGVESFAGNA